MATQARYATQRSVNRGANVAWYSLQRTPYLGFTTPTLPTLTSISPTTGTAAGASLTITCTGTNFVTGITKATVGGRDHLTTFVSATSVTFVFPRPAIAGTYSVNVHNGKKFSTTPKTFTVT